MEAEGKRYRGFLIDADSTLFDFPRAERDALFEALVDLPPSSRTEEVYAAYTRINARLWKLFEEGRIDQADLKQSRFRILLEEMGLKADPALLAELYMNRLGRKGYLLPGARDVLQNLSGRAALALLTNGLASVQRGRVGQAGIEPFFRTIVISEEVGLAKPDPRIFRLAVERLGIPAAGILCVGDSPSTDIRGGHMAGLDTCWYHPPEARYPPADRYPPAEPPPTYRIGRLEELLRFAP
jgi:YjjG family noncanonical pyrimidine nucleotidase